MNYEQLFIDCIPGPTYHFGGHSYGNLASMNSANKEANPKQMALEWLDKVEAVAATGIKQIILPSQPRPLYGFKKDHDLRKLSAAYVWMANSGHFTPSCDTNLKRPIFTPANMNQTVHRNKEHYFNRYWIKKILKMSTTRKLINDDEGAANTIRLSNQNLSKGLNIFVYGNKNSNFPCRQARESIHELINHHQIKHSFILQQHHKAVDAGVFHNDVISFGFKNHLFCHKDSYVNQHDKLDELKALYYEIFHNQLHVIEVNCITLEEAIKTYLFNSQVIINKNRHYLLCPTAVRDNPKTHAIVIDWEKKGYFDNILFTPLTNSLKNGGGPACMRLSIFLTKNEQDIISNEYLTSPKKRQYLRDLFIETYPDTFEPVYLI